MCMYGVCGGVWGVCVEVCAFNFVYLFVFVFVLFWGGFVFDIVCK